jgi:DNA processing protein
MDWDRKHAILMAASEAAPADPSDVADLIPQLAQLGSSTNGATVANQPSPLIEYLRKVVDAERIQYWNKRLHQLCEERPSARLVTLPDEDYPSLLRSAHGRPPFLFLDGKLDPHSWLSLAIVGSREASLAGSDAAYNLAAEAAKRKVLVVSGLASGIDTAAHLGALDHGGKTIAVMATGIDRVYPPKNQQLAQRIRERGGLVSQFLPGSPATRSSFRARNSVISGLAVASVVIEGHDRSGSQNEVEHAIAHSRAVLFWGPLMRSLDWPVRYSRVFRDVQFVDSSERIFATVEARANRLGWDKNLPRQDVDR